MSHCLSALISKRNDDDVDDDDESSCITGCWEEAELSRCHHSPALLSLKWRWDGGRARGSSLLQPRPFPPVSLS